MHFLIQPEAVMRSGGGLYIQSGQVELRNDAFVFNRAEGGVKMTHPYVQGGAASGGAIYNKGLINIINGTLAQNEAQGWTAGEIQYGTGGSAYGGAITVEWNGSLSLLNTTLADNVVQAGEGIKARGMNYGHSLYVESGTVALTNTLLSCSNSPPAINAHVFATSVLQDGGHNISSDQSPLFSMPSSRNNLDPKLDVLGEHGGLTPTLPFPGSPAIDAGDDAVYRFTDQRGVRRPQGLTCDIGAYELAPQLTLHRHPEGTVWLGYLFQAKQTNRISASTDLSN